jgi:hypothetical protein
VTLWEYGRLEADESSGTWKLVWHGPGRLAVEVCNDDLAALNLAGAQGWELAWLAQSSTDHTTRYIFKRARPVEGEARAGRREPAAAASEFVSRMRQFEDSWKALTKLTVEFTGICKNMAAQLNPRLSQAQLDAINTRIAAEMSDVVDTYAAQADIHRRLALQISDDIRARLILVAATSDPSQADVFVETIKRFAAAWLRASDQAQTVSSGLASLKSTVQSTSRSPALADQIGRCQSELAKVTSTRELVEQWLRDLDDIG